MADKQVQEIRQILKKGSIRQQKIAEMYGVSNGHISEIKNGNKRKEA